MSEYWKSTPKYWCKHCSAYVKDTPFERKQHESTGKHQGNLKRFLRGIQNDHERGEREKDKAKAEVDRLNKVVGGQASAAGLSTSKPGTFRKTTTNAPTLGDQKRQWAQLAEMGIQVPDNFRAEMAMPGQWETTSRQIESSTTEDPLSKGVRKRKLEGEEEEEETAMNVGKRRGWGTTTKPYPEQHDPELDALLDSSTTNKDKTEKSELKPEIQDVPTSKLKSETPSDDPEVMSKHLKDETDDRTASENTGSTADQVDIKNENVGVDGQATLTNIPADSTTPVFKKRKFKSKASKAAD